MGLAASQGRYLCLTARNNDLVYEGQQISQQRVALAKMAQEIADEYNAAMNNTIMQATVILNGQPVTQQLTYDLLTNQDPFAGLGMRVIDCDGNVVVPGDYIEMKKEEKNKEPVSTKIYSPQEFISQYMSDLDQDTVNTITPTIAGVNEYYNNIYKSSHTEETAGLTSTYMSNNNKYGGFVKDDEHTYTDPDCLDPKYLQEKLSSGEWLLQKGEGDPTTFSETVWQGSNKIQEVYDTSDDAAAEAKYESDMKALNTRDKVLELRLEEVETEQSAVDKELESIKQVIDKNIEDSFKTFA